LIESGKLGNDYDKTARIHEARRMFRRQQRRELHGKQVTNMMMKDGEKKYWERGAPISFDVVDC
jgi:hypothetical protein